MKQPFWAKYGKSEICGISHSRLRPGKDKDGNLYVIFLPCGHGFYRQPLQIWMQRSEICPICRHPFTTINKNRSRKRDN
jgi:hypothetical protein